jgi:hypothetical protein
MPAKLPPYPPPTLLAALSYFVWQHYLHHLEESVIKLPLPINNGPITCP